MFSPNLPSRVFRLSQKLFTWQACSSTSSRSFHRSCRQCASVSTRSSRNTRETGYGLLVVPLATFCLGTWQVQRRQWKVNLIQQLEERTTADPVPFPLDLDELADLEYRKVVVRGEFDHQKELYVLPRAPVGDNTHGGLIGGSQTSSGAHVITPFKVADRDLTILVNRGWVPRNFLSPEKRKEGQVEGEVELLGVVRKTEARKPFAAKNDERRNRWFHRDVESMAAMAEADPVFLDAARESTTPGGPVGGQTRVTLRNEHLSYIFTWYTLCALTTFMWVRKYMR